MVNAFWPTVFMSLVWILNINKCVADIDSGCPSWGCLPWGSFSLSAGIPSLNSTVSWRVELEAVTSNNTNNLVHRSCISGQETVVCTTTSGYVSIDPTNGKKLWSYTTMSSPYLPVMDTYGDVIGMDVKALYYVGADGKPQRPITLGILKPAHSIMVGNNSILFLAPSTNKTSQVVTYYTDGIVGGAIGLRGTIEGMNGTFLICSQPIIAGFRTYVMTYFLPDKMYTKNTHKTSGMLRLYAIDMLRQMAPRIVIAWYFNFGRWTAQGERRPFPNAAWSQNDLEPIVTYFDGKVYVNVPEGLEDAGNTKTKRQPWAGSLWSIRDDGSGGSLVFRTSCIYGPMAVFDTYDKPFAKAGDSAWKNRDEQHVIWILNRSPAMLQAYDSSNGTVMSIRGLDTIFEKLGGWITSRLSITRHNGQSNDQLVFGMSDSSGLARLVVIEVDNGQAKLLLSHVISKPNQDKNATAYVEGQIVNFAFFPPIEGHSKDSKDEWKFGLTAVVTEMNSTTISRSVVGVF